MIPDSSEIQKKIKISRKGKVWLSLNEYWLRNNNNYNILWGVSAPACSQKVYVWSIRLLKSLKYLRSDKSTNLYYVNKPMKHV